MKCPLLSTGEYTRNVSAPTLSCDCLKEECACWDKELGRCDPTGLIRPLIRLAQALEEIEKRIPFKERLV